MVIITISTSEPESRRIIVKLAASMVSFPSANRASTELAANAINASPVKIIIFNIELFGKINDQEKQVLVSLGGVLFCKLLVIIFVHE